MENKTLFTVCKDATVWNCAAWSPALASTTLGPAAAAAAAAAVSSPSALSLLVPTASLTERNEKQA